MASDRKISMPSSGAGLTRYFDDMKSRIEIKPSHVVILIIAVILLTLLLHSQGKALFGV
tara:strand:+ start:2130 stop:2306 length:177 start_codon:yes stop_codon:yes gene_type:complete